MADTILDRQTEVKAGKKTYKVASARLATIIIASEIISTIGVKMEKEPDNVIYETFNKARHYKVIGDVIAVFILGPKCDNLLNKLLRKRQRVAREIMHELSPSQAQDLLTNIIARSEIGDFFGLSVFLSETNYLKPTRETETTASGQ